MSALADSRAECDLCRVLRAPTRYHVFGGTGSGGTDMGKLSAKRFTRTLLAALAAVSSLVGCDVQTFDDAASSFDGGSSPPPPPPPPPAAFGPNFSEIQAAVFTPDCATSNCHAGANPAANLNLEEANSYTMLVGVASEQDANLKRVDPGNPDSSYLVQKLEGTAGAGQQMPPGNALPQADVDVIRQWITDGAIDDRAQTSAPVRVTSLSPAPGAMLTAAPARITAAFDRDVDASTVNDATFLLVGSGGDATFGDGNETAITAASVTVPPANPASAVLDLAGVTLGDDTYRVTLSGEGASVVLDLDANALDGEYLGSLPSGDSAAGGDFVTTFTVATPVVLGPTLEQIQAVVFTPDCSGCHNGSGNGLPGSMDLGDADASFASLVNVASVQQPALMRVLPFDPDTSYLIHKLEANGTTVMPPSGMLPAATIAEIRQWIMDGAQR